MGFDPDFENTDPNAQGADIFDTTTAALRQEYAERYEALFGSQADAAQKVKQTLTGDLVGIAKNLAEIALHSPNERLRADTAKFILDRMVFNAKASDDELHDFFKAVAGNAEVTATLANRPPGNEPPVTGFKLKPKPEVADTDTSED